MKSSSESGCTTAWSAITAASTNEDGGGGGGIKGLGDAIGAAIFNSKININYQYKPNVNVGSEQNWAGSLKPLCLSN